MEFRKLIQRLLNKVDTCLIKSVIEEIIRQPNYALNSMLKYSLFMGKEPQKIYNMCRLHSTYIVDLLVHGQPLILD